MTSLPPWAAVRLPDNQTTHRPESGEWGYLRLASAAVGGVRDGITVNQMRKASSVSCFLAGTSFNVCSRRVSEFHGLGVVDWPRLGLQPQRVVEALEPLCTPPSPAPNAAGSQSASRGSSHRVPLPHSGPTPPDSLKRGRVGPLCATSPKFQPVELPTFVTTADLESIVSPRVTM